MTVGVYPGSFDPFTVGHLDVLTNAAGLFDLVYVAVLHNVDKRPVFSTEERMEMIRNIIRSEKFDNVRCGTFDGLLVDYAKSVKATHIVRGLRATSDFEYEFQIDAVNRHLDNSLRTVYFMASPGHSFLSSSNVKEIGFWGGSIRGLVPSVNEDIIRERLAKKMSSAQTMKIYSIISRIEQVLNDSPKYKLGGGNKKIVEVEELFDLLGDLKVTIPEDIRRASGIIAEESNILGDANEQAEETISKAKADAEDLMKQAQEAAEKVYNQSVQEYEALVSEESVYQEAVARAKRMQEEAIENANAITNGSRQYADDMLADVQRYMNDYIKMLNSNREELNVQAAPEYEVQDVEKAVTPQRAEEQRPAAPAKQPARPVTEPEEEEEEVVRPARKETKKAAKPAKPIYDDEDEEEEKKKPRKKGWFKRMLEGDDDEDEFDDDEDWSEDDEPVREAPKPKKKRHKLFEIVDVDDDEDEEDYDD